MRAMPEINRIVAVSENLTLTRQWERLNKDEESIKRFVRKRSEYFTEPDPDFVGWQKYTTARDQIIGIHRELEDSECGFSDWFTAAFELLQGLPQAKMTEATGERLEELYKICEENRAHYVAWCKWTNVAS